MNGLVKNRFILKAFISIFFIVPLALADSLDLPLTPLIAGTNVQPNLMLLLDNSGSMKAIVAQETDDGYDAKNLYLQCDSGNTITDGSIIDFYYLTDTDPNVAYFGASSEGGAIFLGNGGYYTYNDQQYSKKCFAKTGSYTGSLNTSHPATGTYSGNFLNWYFQLFSGENYANGKKTNASTRMQATRDVAKELVSELLDIRVGLAQFDYRHGVDILVDIDDIETNRSTLTAQINAMSASTWTPIAESLQDLGYYFSAQAGNDSLTIHEGDNNEYTAKNDRIFDWSQNHNNASDITSAKTVTQYWCQKDFIVLMTDGEPTEDDNISEAIKEYSSTSATLNNSVTNDGVEDGVNVVKAMYETDLRPDLSKDDGTAVLNNVSTYMIGFSSTSATGSRLLSDMATAGGGSDFMTADTSDELLDAFWTASQNIFAKTAAMSALSFNTSEISSDSALFMASFNTSDWSGSLNAYELNDTSNEKWEAGALLDALSSTVSSGDYDDIYDRNILTYNNDSKEGVAFQLANLSDAQKADLNMGIDAASQVKYIYGKTDLDADSYRARTHRLGDIVNSTTVYVGGPRLNWPDYEVATADEPTFGSSASSYSDFKSGNAASRTPIVYVGANDAMLHGFNANTGKEEMAYIPAIIASSDVGGGMHYLADPNYAHKDYVDLTPTVSDVYINNAWRTVLIGGLRAGGKGLFALDVTDPNDFDDSTKVDDLVLWEFSSADDPDFGYSYSEPSVTMMQNGQWAVITGNGYNNSGSGTASLFILFIEQGVDGTWSTSDYIKIDTIVGSAGTPNGLSTPTVVDSDGDRVADRIYAGDLQGNMWAFDVSSSVSSDWKVASGTVSTPAPLFTAKNDLDQQQPITSAPTIIKNANSTAGSPNLMVFFGTGKYLEETDISENLDVMSYYAVVDSGVGNINRSNLTERLLYTTAGLRTVSGNTWTSSSGWYMDLVKRTSENNYTAQGERVVTDSTISGDILFFNTSIPDGSACSSGGDSWYISLDIDTGLAPSYAVFDADNDSVIEDAPADQGGDQGYVGQYYSGGLLSASTVSGSTQIQYTVDSDGNLNLREVNTGTSPRAGRLSWEELFKRK